MRSAVICYAIADRESASNLLRYLRLNCPHVTVDVHEFEDPGDFLDAAETSLSAEYPIVLLSPRSVPEVWRRDEWEPILVEEARRFDRQIAYVLLQECKFPPLLRRGLFFDLSADWLAGLRPLKRWLLDHDRLVGSTNELPSWYAFGVVEAEALKQLESRLADQPGVETSVDRELALQFAHCSLRDFEGVFWLNCANRSRAGILGDLAHAIGLTLRGTVEQNAHSLREFCAEHRMLVALENAAPLDAEWMICAGRSSYLVVANGSPPPQVSLAETAGLFASWRSDANPCFAALGNAQAHLRGLGEYADAKWEIAKSLAWCAYSLMKETGRLAEACEFLNTMIDAMRMKGRFDEAARLKWERDWILEEWGQASSDLPRVMPTPVAVQLQLFN
jgi:TIR domain